MVELKIYLSESLNERFRKTAMNVYGYGRGSLSKAAEEALRKWCADNSEPLERAASSEHPRELLDKEQSGINPDERQSEVDKSATSDQNLLSRRIAENRPLGKSSAVAP